MTTKLFDLPLGARFRYAQMEGTKAAYILLDRGDNGRVALVVDDTSPAAFQGVYSAAETPEEFRKMMVEFVPVQEVQPIAWADKIAFESAMQAGKGCDVWPKRGDGPRELVALAIVKESP